MTHPVADGVEYQQRVDEDLVAIAKTGDNLAMEFLLNKYKNFVRIKAKSYFLIGADREVTSTLMEVYLSSVSQRTNEIVKVLTILSAGGLLAAAIALKTAIYFWGHNL